MIELTDIEGLEACLTASNSAPVVIFKHSTSCGLSAGAYEQVQLFLGAPPANCPPFYLVKVIESRPVSNEIAARLSVQHKSPQMILVKSGQAVWSASHHGINVENITKAVTADQ
jgi:bacillithiol system protein YtxJ